MLSESVLCLIKRQTVKMYGRVDV